MSHKDGSGDTRPNIDERGQSRAPRNGSIVPSFCMNMIAAGAIPASDNTIVASGGLKGLPQGKFFP
jgi:hypothetical protein